MVCRWEDTYVPDIVPGSYGDTIELDIDVETGRITNRGKIDPDFLREIIDKARETE